ncbi:MAG: hypothetical protein RIR33_876 [Pseudomonadota bacterium]|jgi:uncharacterized protein YaiI (UPF0178 family)
MPGEVGPQHPPLHNAPLTNDATTMIAVTAPAIRSGEGRALDAGTLDTLDLRVQTIAMIIYVDADACPVKDEIYKVARRVGCDVRVVANSFIRTPAEPRIQFVLVEAGADAADDWIATRAVRGDVVVTNDIPLAARVLEQGAQAISPTAKVFTTDMIGTALATRGLMEHLRSFGEITSGPAPFSQKDRSAFLSALDAAVMRARRKAV